MKAVTQKRGGFFIFLEKNETFPLSHSYEIQKNIYGKNKKYKERSIMGNHSIQVNSMTKMYRNFMNIYGEKKSPADFLDTLAKKQNGKMSMRLPFLLSSLNLEVSMNSCFLIFLCIHFLKRMYFSCTSVLSVCVSVPRLCLVSECISGI